MKVGDGVLIDASRLGMRGGLLTGIVSDKACDLLLTYFPRVVEREMLRLYSNRKMVDSFYLRPSDITAIIPNQGHWLGKEMP